MFFRKSPRTTTAPPTSEVPTGRWLLVFANTSEVIRAEKVLKEAGYQVQVKGPPPELQTGCDLVIDFPLVEELRVRRLLAAVRLTPLQVVPVTSPLLQPVDIFQIKNYGAYLMVRAANMKLTVEKATKKIVNVSGGGCPDVPYLAQALVDQTLSMAPEPRELGHTLCGYALQLALEKAKQLCSP